MLAKLTVKNQLTLPKAVAARFNGVEYFDVSTDGPRSCSSRFGPARPMKCGSTWPPGITEQDVSDAIEWAREG